MMIQKTLRKLIVQHKRGQRGAALALALVVVGFGTMAIGGLLQYVEANIQSQQHAQQRLLARSTADAGIEQFMEDFRARINAPGGTPYGEPEKNQDLWQPSGTMVNGKTPVVKFTSWTRNAADTERTYIVESRAPGVTTRTFEVVHAKVTWSKVGGTQAITLTKWEVE